METHLAQSAGTWDSESGAFISADHQRLAAILHDYNPYMSLVWVPPKDRDATDTKPFAILSEIPGKAPHIVRYLSEDEMKNPTAILQWVFEGDVVRNRPGDIFAKIEARENAAKLMDLKRQEEEMEARHDFIDFAVSNRSPHWWRHNGREFKK